MKKINVMRKFLIVLPVIGMLFTACEDVIDVKINEESIDLYAVEAKITTADQPTVFLTKGMPVTIDQPFNGISNAIVTISDDSQPNNEVILIEDPDRLGIILSLHLKAILE